MICHASFLIDRLTFAGGRAKGFARIAQVKKHLNVAGLLRFVAPPEMAPPTPPSSPPLPYAARFRTAPHDNKYPLAGSFRPFVARPSFPCVGAKSALAKGQLQFIVARDIQSGWDDMRIYPALFNFAKRYRTRKKPFQSFVVRFRGPQSRTATRSEKHTSELP